MQSVLRTLLKKQNENKAHTHTHFTFLQEHGNILNTVPQEIVLLNTKRKKMKLMFLRRICTTLNGVFDL